MLYITADDQERLQTELKDRIALRKTLSARIGAARELGDLKENAEYHAAKEDQGMNEAKIRDIEFKLANSIVADTTDLPDDVVFVGATVRLRNVDTDDEDTYRLVGEATGSFDLDYVEVTTESPMGMALMKSRLGEVVRVDLPRGEKRFEIVKIEI